jgi:hypothetical protein
LKLFQELGDREMIENNGGVNSNMIYLIHCNNLCKCSSVSPPRTIVIKNKLKKRIDGGLHLEPLRRVLTVLEYHLC